MEKRFLQNLVSGNRDGPVKSIYRETIRQGWKRARRLRIRTRLMNDMAKAKDKKTTLHLQYMQQMLCSYSSCLSFPPSFCSTGYYFCLFSAAFSYFLDLSSTWNKVLWKLCFNFCLVFLKKRASKLTSKWSPRLEIWSVLYSPDLVTTNDSVPP